MDNSTSPALTCNSNVYDSFTSSVFLSHTMTNNFVFEFLIISVFIEAYFSAMYLYSFIKCALHLWLALHQHQKRVIVVLVLLSVTFFVKCALIPPSIFHILNCYMLPPLQTSGSCRHRLWGKLATLETTFSNSANCDAADCLLTVSQLGFSAISGDPRSMTGHFDISFLGQAMLPLRAERVQNFNRLI